MYFFFLLKSQFFHSSSHSEFLLYGPPGDPVLVVLDVRVLHPRVARAHPRVMVVRRVAQVRWRPVRVLVWTGETLFFLMKIKCGN